MQSVLLAQHWSVASMPEPTQLGQAFKSAQAAAQKQRFDGSYNAENHTPLALLVCRLLQASAPPSQTSLAKLPWDSVRPLVSQYWICRCQRRYSLATFGEIAGDPVHATPSVHQQRLSHSSARIASPTRRSPGPTRLKPVVFTPRQASLLCNPRRPRFHRNGHRTCATGASPTPPYPLAGAPQADPLHSPASFPLHHVTPPFLRLAIASLRIPNPPTTHPCIPCPTPTPFPAPESEPSYWSGTNRRLREGHPGTSEFENVFCYYRLPGIIATCSVGSAVE